MLFSPADVWLTSTVTGPYVSRGTAESGSAGDISAGQLNEMQYVTTKHTRDTKNTKNTKFKELWTLRDRRERRVFVAIEFDPMNIVILSARSGWHTDELCRALAARGAVGHVMAYDRLVARIAPQAGTSAARTSARLGGNRIAPRIVRDGG